MKGNLFTKTSHYTPHNMFWTYADSLVYIEIVSLEYFALSLVFSFLLSFPFKAGCLIKWVIHYNDDAAHSTQN